jgi:hypothetical protein
MLLKYISFWLHFSALQDHLQATYFDETYWTALAYVNKTR